MGLKWIWVVLLAVIGILAAIVAVEYLTVSIHHLPSWIPGHRPHVRGHYHKRGAIAALIALVAFVAAGYLAYRFTRTDHPAAGETGPTPAGPEASADDLLASPPHTLGTASDE